MNISLTIVSLIVIIAGFVGLGDVIKQEEVANIVNAVIQIVGIAGVWYGRYRQQDITWFGTKK